MSLFFIQIFSIGKSTDNIFSYLRYKKQNNMAEPYDGYETLWAKYNDVAQENKEKRKLKGQWKADEPKEFIYDESTPEAEVIEFDGEPPMIIDYDWRYSNLYSQCWVADLFGADFRTVQQLLFIRDVEMVNVNGNI